jgi:anti-sigma factor RsiW
MNCREAETLLHPYFDGELDLMSSVGIEGHLTTCGACGQYYRDLQDLRREISEARLDFAPKPALARRVQRVAGQPWWRHPGALAAAAALLVALFLPMRLLRTPSEDREVLDSHLRSLMADHLVDVPSSDHHTVKPWFQGRLSFSPDVPELAAQGFVLTGGRLDVLHRAPAAAIVYKRRNHVINLFVAATTQPDSGLREQSIEGYHLVEWNRAGMTYWAVSDLNREELRQFADLARGH